MTKRLAVLLAASLLMSAAASAAPHGIYPVRAPGSPKVRVLNKLDPSAGVKVLYYGGPVISNVKAYNVFWGPSVDATAKKQLSGFMSATVNSSYFDWMGQYNTVGLKAVDGREGTNQK